MAEPHTTLSTEALERFLADRAPVMAPARLADAVVVGVVGLPQERRGWTPPWLSGRSGTRGTLVPVSAVVAVGLLVALLGLVYAARPQPVLPDPTWVRSSIGLPGSFANVVGGGGDSLLAATWPNGDPTEDNVWRSVDDGVTWAPIANEAPFAGSSIGGFLQLDHRVLAYGSRYDKATGHETIATWASDDGASWHLLSDAGSANPLDGQQQEHLDAVVPGGPGFVGIGTATGSAYDGPTAWSSADGVTWTRRSALGGALPVGLVRMPGGFFALTGSNQTTTASTSADGLTWSPAAFPDVGDCTVELVQAQGQPGDICVADIANLPGGMPLGAIAVGSRGTSSRRPSAWITRDALTWTEMALPLPPEPCAVTSSWPTCPAFATAVAGDADHVVVAGSTMTAQAGPLRAVFWTSRDGGQTWEVSDADPALVLDPQRSDNEPNGIVDLWPGGPNAFYAAGRSQAGATVWTGHPFPSSAP